MIIDGRLVAVDAATGKPVWSVVTGDQSQAFTITQAPRVIKGRVLIGMSGGEYGIRGYISAYDAETGKLAWRFYTAVGLPSLGRLASADWMRVGHFLGPSIRGFYERHPLEALVGYWQRAGLRDVRVRRMSLGGGIVMSATREG